MVSTIIISSVRRELTPSCLIVQNWTQGKKPLLLLFDGGPHDYREPPNNLIACMVLRRGHVLRSSETAEYGGGLFFLVRGVIAMPARQPSHVVWSAPPSYHDHIMRTLKNPIADGTSNRRSTPASLVFGAGPRFCISIAYWLGMQHI